MHIIFSQLEWFCTRGDQQIEGIDFFEKYAPVIQWTTIHLMPNLEVLLELKLKDITAEFLHANSEEEENVFVEISLGFQQKEKVLKLKRTLYGLCEASCQFLKYLVKKMEVCAMSQSKLDPWLFFGENVICICYVDNLLFWSKDEVHINEFAILLYYSGVDLEQENAAASFLGVRIENNESGLLEMKQEGLIDCVLEAPQLDIGTVNRKATSAEVKFLVRISYSSVVDMMLYLFGHSKPDIAYAVYCTANYLS